MGTYRSRKTPKIANDDLEQHLDDLDEYIQFRQKVLPELREMLVKGTDDKKMLSTFSKHAVARLISIALSEKDNAKALVACKDLLDRVHGRATENKSIKHEFTEMSDQQLDAMIKTEIDDMDEEDDAGPRQ